MFGIIAPYSIVYTVVVWLIWGFQLDNLGQDQQMTNSVKFLCLERLSLVFLGTGTFFLSAIEESQSCTCFQHGCSYKVDATSWRIEPAGRAILGFCCSLVIGHFFLYMRCIHLVWLVFLMNMIFNGICDFLYFWISFANVFFINMLRAHIFESRYSRCSSSSCCGYQVINLNQMALWIGRTLAGWTDSYHTLPMLRVMVLILILLLLSLQQQVKTIPTPRLWRWRWAHRSPRAQRTGARASWWDRNGNGMVGQEGSLECQWNTCGSSKKHKKCDIHYTARKVISPGA